MIQTFDMEKFKKEYFGICESNEKKEHKRLDNSYLLDYEQSSKERNREETESPLSDWSKSRHG